MERAMQEKKVRSIDTLPVFFGRTHGVQHSSSSEAKVHEVSREARRCSLSRDSIESCSSLASTAHHGQQKREQDLEFEISDAIQVVEDAATRAVLGMMMNYLKEVKTNILNKIESQEKMQKSSHTRLEESIDAMRKWIVGWTLREEPESAGDRPSLNARMRQRMSAGGEGPALRTAQSEHVAKASQPPASGQPSAVASASEPKGEEWARRLAESRSKTKELPPRASSQEAAEPRQRAELMVSNLPTWLRLSHMSDKTSTSANQSKESLGAEVRPLSQDFESSFSQARSKAAQDSESNLAPARPKVSAPLSDPGVSRRWVGALPESPPLGNRVQAG